MFLTWPFSADCAVTLAESSEIRIAWCACSTGGPKSHYVILPLSHTVTANYFPLTHCHSSILFSRLVTQGPKAVP
jgi:hypothetical protein